MVELKKYKLGELLEVTRGASLSGEYYATEGEYIRLTCGNFDYNNNCFKENTSKENLYYIGPIRPEFIMKQGDIITPLTEQAIGLLGSTALIPESGKYIQSQDVAKITCNEDLLYPFYAYYLISSNLVKNQLSAGAQQTKIRHTSPDKIKDCIVWVPIVDKQKKIADLLMDIDRKIALNQAINRNLEALAKQIYDYWFVQFDFPDDNGKPYKSSGGKMVWNEMLKREVPVGWEVKLVGEAVDIKRGKTITEKETTTGNVKVVAAGLDFSYYHNVSNRASNCITISGSGENAGFVNFWREPIYASDCSTIQFENVVDTLLCYYTLKTQEPRFYRISHKSAQPHIYPSDITVIPMVFPKKEVKEKIANLFVGSNNQIGENIHEIERLTALRDELLPLLMNGQVKIEN